MVGCLPLPLSYKPFFLTYLVLHHTWLSYPIFPAPAQTLFLKVPRGLASKPTIWLQLIALPISGCNSVAGNFSSFQPDDKLCSVRGWYHFSFIHTLCLSHHALQILGTSTEFIHLPIWPIFQISIQRWRCRQCPFPVKIKLSGCVVTAGHCFRDQGGGPSLHSSSVLPGCDFVMTALGLAVPI